MDWSIAGDIRDLTDTTLNLYQTAYSTYQDQRNFEYQKELQEELWRRDDTAIQRRVRDAVAAGINPNAVVGSGAGVTSAGGASSTAIQNQGISAGSRFDFLQKLEMLNQQKEMTKIAVQQAKQAKVDTFLKNKEKEIADQQLSMLANERKLSDAYASFMLGNSDPDANPLARNLANEMLYTRRAYENSVITGSLLGGDLKFQTANKWLDMINSATGSVGNIGRAFRDVMSGVNGTSNPTFRFDFSNGKKYQNYNRR